MHVLRKGDHFIVKIDTGEGIEYAVADSLVYPFKMIKTLSEVEVEDYEIKESLD